MRNKMIELLDGIIGCGYELHDRIKVVSNSEIADHLIANGAILPEFLKIRETKYIPPFNEKNDRPHVLVLLECGEKTFGFAVPITSRKSISCLGCLHFERGQQKCNRCSRSYYMRDYYTQEPPQEDE